MIRWVLVGIVGGFMAACVAHGVDFFQPQHDPQPMMKPVVADAGLKPGVVYLCQVIAGEATCISYEDYAKWDSAQQPTGTSL